jgi:hypothetical protein
MISTVNYKQESQIDLKKIYGGHFANLRITRAKNMIVNKKIFKLQRVSVV